MKLRFNAITLVISLILLASYAATPASQTQDNALPHVYVFGEVNQPGVYAIRSPVTIQRALVIAGGLPKEATGRDTIIFRKPSGGGKLQMIKVDVIAVMMGKTKDVPLENDDVIIVNRDRTSYAESPAAQTLDNTLPHIFVFGEVAQPGVYLIKPPVTLRMAISLAKGATYESRLRDTIIFRKPSGDGKQQMIKVDLNAVMAGKAEDVPLEDDDVILVNRNKQRTNPSLI